MKSFRDYLGLSNSCSYDVDDVIGRADRFGFQNFCSPGAEECYIFPVSLINKIKLTDDTFSNIHRCVLYLI